MQFVINGFRESAYKNTDLVYAAPRPDISGTVMELKRCGIVGVYRLEEGERMPLDCHPSLAKMLTLKQVKELPEF